MSYMKKYVESQGYVIAKEEVPHEALLVCPFCSAEINELGECKVTCGAWRNPKLRLDHLVQLRVIRPEWKNKRITNKEVSN